LLLEKQTDKAVAALQKAVELDPGSSSVLTKLGIVHMAQNRNEKAKETFLKAVAINPDDRFANQRLGMLFDEAKDIDKAVSFYERGLKGTPPDYIGIKVDLARLYNMKRQFGKTIALLETVLTPETKNVTGHILLGTAFFYTAGQAEKAITQYQYAAAIDPAAGSVPLGVAYRVTGKLEESKKALLEAEKAKPNDPFILIELAETIGRQGNYQDALQGFAKAIEAGYPKTQALRRIATLQMQNRKYKEAIQTLQQVTTSKEQGLHDHFVLAEAYQLDGQFSAAEKLLRALTEKHPKDPGTWYRLGLHYGLTRDYKTALTHFNEAKKLSPEDPGVLKALALAYFQSGKKDEAIQQAQALNRIQPKNPDDAFFLASLYQEAGKTKEAIKGYEDVLKTAPGHGPSLNNLADLTAQSGDLATAVKLADQAVAAEPENSRYLDTLGWISFQSGNIDTATTVLEKAFNLSPKSPVLNFHLGKVYIQKGNKEKAKQMLQFSISQPASAPWSDEAKKILKSMD
jgi:tetratricopeptide (TPR) repeat protein